MDTKPDPHRVVIEERVAELWRWRRWYREHRWAEWSDLRRENYVLLRELVKLAREARKVEADPVTLAKGYEDWTTGELVAGSGK